MPPPGKDIISRGPARWLIYVAYNADMPPPPRYQPPEGASKVNPDQDWSATPLGHPSGIPGPAGTQDEYPGSSSATPPATSRIDIHEPAPDLEAPKEAPKKPGFFAKLNPLR